MSEADYGAEAANTRFFGAAAGGGAEFNYLALRDHPAASGVPLGGIGVGCVGLAPDGRFTRIGINNTFRPLDAEDAPGCFFAVWQAAAKPLARRLVRGGAPCCGMSAFAHSTYRGLFPAVMMSFDEAGAPDWNLRVGLEAFSGLVPHNVKDSALPAVHFAVHLVNTAMEPREAAVAFSWQDLIGRGLVDVPDLEGFPEYAHWKLADHFTAGLSVPTGTAPFRAGAWRGVRQFARAPLKPRRATFQNYVREVALLAEAPADGEFSCLPRYALTDGDAAWAGFRQSGRFAPVGQAFLPVRADRNVCPTAAAIAVRAALGPGQTRAFRFALLWHMPELKINPRRADRRSYWPGCDYGRYYHRFFPSLARLAAYALRARARVRRQVAEWHAPVLAATLPAWLKFKLLNSAYTLYPQTILNKAGAFTVMEGEMGGLTGTMDQRLAAHPAYQKFFTALDRAEMQAFADTAGPEGEIRHFCGSYFFGVAAPGHIASPTPEGWMLDNTGAWIIQLAKDYAQTGDREYLERNAAGVRRGLAFLKSRIVPGTEIPAGKTTYDDYPHPPIFIYAATIYLATLRAGAVIGRALGDARMARECEAQSARTRRGCVRLLWNGRCFAYGCEKDGSRRRDELVFTGQLAGQFVSRHATWGDLFPLEMVRAALVAQFKTALAHAPDYYANKLYNTALHMGVDMPGSQCWPFYLESYTAMAAIQAGYVEDGLELLRRIQLVHLRLGYTWCQNIWNPGPVTYMSAPVTWFITDVLAGAGLDVPSGTLFLAPVPRPGRQRVRLPLYFPRLWAELEYEPERGRAVLHVRKTFYQAEPVTIRRLVSEPVGTPSAARRSVKLRPVTLEAGTTLDLSPHAALFSGAVLHPAVLPRAEEVEFLEYRATRD